MDSPTNPVFSEHDRAHMRAALTLARRGLGNVAPNPAVGCVLVRPDLGANGRVVGRGWTQPDGRPHAETEAIRRAAELAKSSHAYVTLEPCNHEGQTGPCTEALIAAGISAVTIALSDPDPRVQGAGIQRLTEAGLIVRTGLLEDEARALNAGFLSVQERGRPWVTLKVATSADGMIAAKKGEQLWITGPEARKRGHLIRSQHDGILTGVGTIIADDPQLTCRLPGLEKQSPRRFILDTRLRTPEAAQIFGGPGQPETTIFIGETTADVTTATYRRLTGTNRIVRIEDIDGHIDLGALTGELAKQGITRLMVEGGQGINTAFLAADLIDEIVWFRAPNNIGKHGVRAFSVEESKYPDQYSAFTLRSVINLDDDRLERYLRVR